MTANRLHRLDGLEPDNLLAFLALVGFLRTLEASRSGWRPRLGWDLSEAPLRPTVQLAEEVEVDDLASAVVEGLAILAPAQNFDGRKSIDFPSAEARAGLQDIDEDRRRVFECLVSDAAYKDDGRPFQPPLCMMFGQGHQHFLERLSAAPVIQVMTGSRDQKAPEEAISETLFRPWIRKDATDAFRWDPLEANRYALRAKNPSTDNTAKTTQHGANQLAAIGLPAMPVIPVCRAGEPRILSIGSAYDVRGSIVFRWPIWTGFATLRAIQAMLSHPGLHDAKQRYGLRTLGVQKVMEARRISVGKFMNVEPAKPVSAL